MAALFLAFVASPASAAETLGVFGIRVSGLGPGFARMAIDAVAGAASSMPGYTVLSRNDLDALIEAEKLKDLVGCDDVSCFTELGLAAGVRRVLTGDVARVDERFVVSLQLIDTKAASVEKRVTLEWTGQEAELPNVVGAATEKLLGPAETSASSSLAVTGVPPRAVIVVDGSPRGTGPIRVAGLDVGVHRLHVDSSDHEPYDMPFVTRRGESTILTPPLARKPLYTRWWFWTGTAAVAGAGIAAMVLFWPEGPGSGTYVVPAPPM